MRTHCALCQTMEHYQYICTSRPNKIRFCYGCHQVDHLCLKFPRAVKIDNLFKQDPKVAEPPSLPLDYHHLLHCQLLFWYNCKGNYPPSFTSVNFYALCNPTLSSTGSQYNPANWTKTVSDKTELDDLLYHLPLGICLSNTTRPTLPTTFSMNNIQGECCNLPGRVFQLLNARMVKAARSIVSSYQTGFACGPFIADSGTITKFVIDHAKFTGYSVIGLPLG
ncbi:hypothetical protein PHYBLDRAFT_144509 [Phycomyces blakesleeanus NRRL 1555(-)]|uniref:Uncharacterized protein n=1 Tax=Phycomyces blakesleeanus (strain ATCC 8743b / DSM 1359 / FGSC 10004 / NBRC 33097 / NRRL 1555) TaxID=763407 RepID=A0A162UC87_PHYB8|nr:hypothetical protein PHYBLDRAFT_144509 [Phycomyces blakesleeanus NRRL 1555(-)]OAD75162.1 hypothetical protein PHYBLDRAFT_144509 [Phycomyces blakesleeanus NRRL 1555(-)]|eukprot:XP_018293202.1 hypothetical protein PHYBLDRAFT_144509 [Phycomyces blakesleeanus NRRL 1555(-)]